MKNTSIYLPDGLVERARRNGINISRTCANALLASVLKIEYVDVRSTDLPQLDSKTSTAPSSERVCNNEINL